MNRMILTSVGLLAAAGWSMTIAPERATAGADAYSNLPAQIELIGIVRDFRERSVDGGHPDFERRPDGGFGHYVGYVADELDENDKPVYVGGAKKIKAQAKDANGNAIHPSLADTSRGDTEASYASGEWTAGIESAASYAQWFRDVPGVNMSGPLAITLVRQPGTNTYTFDDRNDKLYEQRGGFFPINNELYGNSLGGDKNFHFTFELATEFVYDRGAGQTFTFRGDDDVLVFINGQIVIDIGGVHSAVQQTVSLDDLDFVNDGEINTLHFFFAERHRTQSNFRIETTLNLRNAELPSSMDLFD
jgi:fibro-slime domain-containing protein